MTKILVFCAFILSCSIAAATTVLPYEPSLKECFSVEGTVPWKYCVHTPANGPTNGAIAYQLHGRDLSENTWNDSSYYTAMIQQYWQTHQLTPPTVVTISFGKIWLLAPRGLSPASGLLDMFIHVVIPTVEARLGKPSSRILFGESMGGLNSLFASLHYPETFQRVAALCPVIYKISPFDTPEDIDIFVSRTGANPSTIQGIIQLAKVFFATAEEWVQASPLTLIETIDPKTAPKFYVSCGNYDAYGNFEGNLHLVERAHARGMSLAWRPLYGGHCVIDVPSVAKFLAQ